MKTAEQLTRLTINKWLKVNRTCGSIATAKAPEGESVACEHVHVPAAKCPGWRVCGEGVDGNEEKESD